MKITELAALTGVTPASIKYYAREGLLPPAVRTSSNQTEYAELHAARLRLVRALIEEADLTIAQVRGVVVAIEDTSLPITKMLGAAQQSVSRPRSAPSAEALERVRAVIDRHGWIVSDGNPGLQRCAAVLDRLAELDRADLAGMLEAFAEHAEAIAAMDIDSLAAPTSDRDRMAETVVIGGFLGDTIVSGLRQMAQESISRQRYAPPPNATA